MITIRPDAVREIKRLSTKQNQPKTLFRLGVQPGGCSGLVYTLDFDETVNREDRVYDCSGLQVAIAAQALDYINGLTLDYSEDMMGGGFRFQNPNAIQNCGCGNSFSTQS